MPASVIIYLLISATTVYTDLHSLRKISEGLD